MSKHEDKRESVINLATVINEEFYMNWSELATDINLEIQESNCKKLKTRHVKQWANIFKYNYKYTYDYWCELESVLTNIKNNKNKGSNVTKARNPQFSFTEKKYSVRKIKYSLSKLQDVIIPFIYKSAYNFSFEKKIEFLLDVDWGKCLEKITLGDIDIAIHNFSTVFAYAKGDHGEEELFFFPLFVFSGYGICIKKEILRKFGEERGKSFERFEDLGLYEQKEFIEKKKVILERNTDLEWIYKKFCKKYGCREETIAGNIIDLEISKGKVEFLEDSEVGFYCTNSIHIADLRENENIEILEDDINHHNYNGLICKMDFFNNNKEIIYGLISIWFNNITQFQEDLKCFNRSKNKNSFTNFHTFYLLHKLNEITSSTVSAEEFVASYEKNIFFGTVGEAALSFIYNVLDNEDMVLQNMEIAEVQLQNAIDNKMVIGKVEKNLIKSLKEQIKNFINI